MSTRSTVHFKHGQHTEAIVYRHSDGYPSGAGVDFYRFFAAVDATTVDGRFNDATMLAARYVVWLSKRFARSSDLDFLDARIVIADPGDIQYCYEIDCDDAGTYDAPKWPSVKCWDVREGCYVVIPLGEQS